MAINKKAIPYQILKEFTELLKKSQELASRNSEIVNFSYEPENLSIFLKDKDAVSGYHYTLISPHMPGGTNQKPSINFKRFPRNQNNITEYNGTDTMESAIDGVVSWISIIKMFDELSLTLEDKIEKDYKKKLYAEFEIIEDNADVDPFDEERQIAIINLLEYIEERSRTFPEQDAEIAEIIVEAKTLKNSVQKISKNATVKSLAKILTRAKMKGSDYFKYLFGKFKDEAIKFVFKQILEGGQEIITSWIDNIPK